MKSDPLSPAVIGGTMRPMPDRKDIVLRYVFEGWAARKPERTCVSFEDGSEWTWAELVEAGCRAANTLAARGVQRGDYVLINLPNGPAFLRAWFGTAFLGATMVPINPALRGDLLFHHVQDSRARVAVTAGEPGARVRGLQLVEVIDPTELVAEVAAPPRLDPPLEPWDIATVNYTSGTTGPSKGVLTTYMQLVQTSLDSRWDMRPGDCMLVMSPLFHIGGQMPAVAGLVAGERIALRGQFSGSTFLDVVREVGVTQAFLVGTMGAFIDALPAQPADVENPLRELMIAPMVPDPDAFRARFGVDTLICAFGMSECGIGTIAWNPPSEKRNTAGRAREGAEIRVVDEHDIPVPAGQVGELIIRTERPWELTVGYLNRPDETARAWRNGWFHTGDAFHVDEDGWFYFADRIKDSLRRRGDNISSFEVERSVSMFDGVAEAACVAAPGQYGDDEVKVSVRPPRDP